MNNRLKEIKEEDDNITTVMCLSREAAKGGYVTDGSTMEKCADCGTQVFVSLSTQSSISKEKEKGRTIEFRCMNCSFEHIKHLNEVKLVPLSEEQFKDVAAYFTKIN